jgi:hypothetical protein
MESIDYTNDPRSILIHAGGNPYHDPKTGMFTTASGSFGTRKYVNPDGTLTKRGQERFEEEKRRNRRKKKDDRVKDENDLLDPKLWSRQDTERQKGVVDSASKMVTTLKDINRDLPKNDKFKKMDLSDMSDAELRQRLTRLQTEAAYKNALANSDTVKTGREYVDDVLKYAGSALAITSSALGIALAIKQLRS